MCSLSLMLKMMIGLTGRRRQRVSCLGDVVIAPEVARENALNEGATLSHELRVLLTHGLLHLLGYDHETDSGEMLSEQQRLLQDLEGELPDDLV